VPLKAVDELAGAPQVAAHHLGRGVLAPGPRLNDRREGWLDPSNLVAFISEVVPDLSGRLLASRLPASSASQQRGET
jgi:hypothetical protein